MKQKYLDIGVLAIILILLYIKPPVLTQLTTTIVGRIIMVVLIFIGAQKSLLIGVSIAIMFVFFLDDGYEGMTGDQDQDQDQDPRAKIRDKYCKEGSLVDTSGNPVDVSNLDCNPCDDTCDFDVKDVRSLLDIEDGLRPKKTT